MKVMAIYDNGGATTDRYTVITDEIGRDYRTAYLGMGEGGDWYSQWGELLPSNTAEIFNADNGQYRTKTYLGKLVHFEQLSEASQQHIARRFWETH